MPAIPVKPQASVVTPDQRRRAAEQFQIANQWLVSRRPERALPLLQECCRLEPANLIYRQGLRTARHQGQPVRGWMSAVKKRFARGRLRKVQAAHNWIALLQAGEDLLALDAANGEAHLGLAQAFEALGLCEHAAWCLEQARNENDQNPAIASELARLYERTGRFGLAREMAQASEELSPEVEAEVGRLREQIAAAPGDPRLYSRLAEVFWGAGARQAARDWLSRGLMATGNDFKLGVLQARLDLDTLGEDAAEAEKRLAERPEDLDLQMIVARLRHEIQAREIELCRQQCDRNPQDKNGRLQFGVLLLKAGQLEAALEVFLTLRSDEQLAWRAVLYAGYCHLNNRQWRRARPLFEEALALMPAEAEATRREVTRLLGEHTGENGTR